VESPLFLGNIRSKIDGNIFPGRLIGMTMRTNKVFLFLLALAVAAPAVAQQSLGDAARQNRSKKKTAATVKLTDENLPRPSSAPEEEVAKPTAPPVDKDQAKKNDADTAKQKQEAIKKGIEDQKKQIAGLQRELDLLQREQRLRAAAFYADAGTRLRDSGKFEEDAKKEQADIDTKKQALDAAQQKLADLNEQARKAGIASKEE
jgi:hypothetical protein